jgi:hypothetical protein
MFFKNYLNIILRNTVEARIAMLGGSLMSSSSETTE